MAEVNTSESQEIAAELLFYFHLLISLDECQTKYGNVNAWRNCCRVFDLLTIGAVSITALI